MFRNTHHRRIVFLALLALMSFGGLSVRLIEITTLQSERFVIRADEQHRKRIDMRPRRGEILDRSGDTLASSVLCETLTVNRWAASEATRDAVARACAEIFGRPAPDYRRRLEGVEGRVSLVSRMDPEPADQVREFIRSLDVHNDHVYLVAQTRRHYPFGYLAGPVIGFTHLDHTGENSGVAGVELAWNRLLRGRLASDEVLQNSAQQRLEPLRPEMLIASAGHRIHLTIDRVIQSVAEDALREAVEHYEADWGTAVALDPRTGEVLAMANWPSFDLNDHGAAPEAWKRNHAMRTPLEMGSVMKIFTFAAAMEEGLITEEELVDCHGGVWVHPLYHFRVTDDHDMEIVTIREAFAESSNIAAVQIAGRFAPPVALDAPRSEQIGAGRGGATRLMTHLRAFGFGRRTGIDLRGEHAGSLPDPSTWGLTGFRALPEGQGASVTALQTAAAVGAIANGGLWQTPHIVSRVENAVGQEVEIERETAYRQVVSTLTARRMLRMMEEVVISGTGTEAQIAGFRVGGKTGTADRYDEEVGGYSGRNPTFAGVAPIEDPRVACVVFISNPNLSIGRYGGEVAAPVFRRIVEATLRVQGVVADPLQVAGEAAPEVLIDQAHTASRMAPAGSSNSDFNLPAVVGNRMPDLSGRTMREAARMLARTDLSVRFEGTGRAVSQDPPPGARLEDVARGVVVFEEGDDGVGG